MPFEKYSGSERVELPDEAYSRVTNPERFRPLHDAMLEMLNDLETLFDVERIEGHGLDEELESRSRDLAARPSIVLDPTDPEAASITVVFTDFPGLHMRLGRWYTDLFPSCGCDACDESAEGEIERATEMIESVTSGGFREAVIHSPRSLPSTICDMLRGNWAPMPARRRYLKYAPADVGDMSGEELASARPEPIRGSRRETEFRGPSLRMTNKKSMNDARALEITGGQPSFVLDWKPWPLRPDKSETGAQP